MYMQQLNKTISAKTLYQQQNLTSNFIDLNNSNYLLNDNSTISSIINDNLNNIDNSLINNCDISLNSKKQLNPIIIITTTTTTTPTQTIIEHNNNASTSNESMILTYSQTISSQQLNQQNLIKNKKIKFTNFDSNLNECFGCKQKITERYLLQIDESFWHENCLCCIKCKCNLAKFNEIYLSKCYIRNNQVYCKEDYLKLFAEKCAQCGERLKSTDLVFHCFQRTYHCYCFKCAYCNQSLKHGDQFVYINSKIICHRDYCLTFLCEIFPNKTTTIVDTKEVKNQLQSLAFDKLRNHHLIPRSFNNNSKKISKRPRTILNAHQRKAFKHAFERGSKPSRKVREQLAKDTGLSIRVVQVWFQNQRAKVKKEQRKGDTSKNFSSQSSLTISTDSDSKSVADDESKSLLGSIKSDSDIDSEDFDFNEDVISGRSSVSQSLNLSVEISKKLNEESIYLLKFQNDEKNSNELNLDSINPIDNLYRMHQTYFPLP